MFKLFQSTSVGSDCTCAYDVELDKEYTAADFVAAVLKDNVEEWGKFRIKKKTNAIDSFEYRYGKLINSPFNASLNYKIQKAYASGGWSRMDYTLYIEEVEDIKPRNSENTKGALRFIVKKPDGEESVVVIFKNKSDNTYSFVNLTKEHICACRFNTIEEAIQDMNNRVAEGLIQSYIVKGDIK